jgi:hypothetical protein
MLHRNESNFRLVAHNKTNTSKQNKEEWGSRKSGNLHRKALSVTMVCEERRHLVALSFRMWEKFAIEDCQLVDILCTDIFDCGRIVHHKCVPKGQTFNRRFYREVLQRLGAHVRRKRPEWGWSQGWLNEHKNAPAHPVVSVRTYWPLNQWLWPPILLINSFGPL